MGNYNFIGRIYGEEIEKLQKKIPEFKEKGVDVTDLLIALTQMMREDLDKMERAIVSLDEAARNQIIKDSQVKCEETRKRVDELANYHLGKRHL